MDFWPLVLDHLGSKRESDRSVRSGRVSLKEETLEWYETCKKIVRGTFENNQKETEKDNETLGQENSSYPFYDLFTNSLCDRRRVGWNQPLKVGTIFFHKEPSTWSVCLSLIDLKRTLKVPCTIPDTNQYHNWTL